MTDADLVAAALRADADDVDTLVRVLTSTLGETLPAGMVEIERQRSLADRMAGRDGIAVGLTVTTPELRLRLTHGRKRGAGVRAEVHRVVRDVVISRREVGIDEWVALLAQAIADLAARNSAARAALGRLLEG
jgi:hypothetical protein